MITNENWKRFLHFYHNGGHNCGAGLEIKVGNHVEGPQGCLDVTYFLEGTEFSGANLLS